MTIQEAQDKIRLFCETHRLASSPEHRLLDVVSEIGEVAKEILTATDYGKRPIAPREETRSEIGDAFYSLIALANALDINLEKTLELVLMKYERRLAHGGAGSEYESAQIQP
ncbi:MazG-like family protein [Candidatus Parcubacteria bacterium]|nr:MazG-like family protein [Candidatus Parcubacteria bacterium]MBI4385224.1 MazG-like family protein [Candidatus Parcubacteria bacterium]